jgi:prepilin-type N-terminal cleavage/methylation domain-containing protein
MHRNVLLRRKKAGFTLVEIMVSMIVLALLASGFFSILVSARYMVNRTALRSAAIEVARSEMERMRMLIGSDVWWTAGAYPLQPGSWSALSLSPVDPRFSTRFRVRTVPGLECREVTVQVSWNVPKI